MNAMEAFLGLLVLAYLGNSFMGGRSIRGYGLPSGSEYLLLGFAVGPVASGFFDRDILTAFEPILQVGICWMALLTGLGWGVIEQAQKSRVRTLIGSLGLALLSGALVALCVYFAAGRITSLTKGECLLLASAAGAVGTETTRIAVRWVFERHGASGPLSRLIAALADSDELPALLLVALICAFVPVPNGRLPLGPWGWLGVTLGLGLALGLICVALLGRNLHKGEALSFVLGATLLGTGVSVQLGLSGVTAMFVLGLTLSATSRHRIELRALLQKSETPVMLPVLVLAGASLKFDSAPYVPAIVAVALAARVLAKWLSGLSLLLIPVARPAGAWLGLGLLPSGVVTVCIGLAISLRLRSPIGDLALTLAATTALFGEVVGPLALKRAMARAGELGHVSEVSSS